MYPLLAKETVIALVGDDTGLLVLLLFQVQPQHYNAVFTSDTKSVVKVWDIRDVQIAFGADICENILLDHAVSSCDTTSSLNCERRAAEEVEGRLRLCSRTIRKCLPQSQIRNNNNVTWAWETNILLLHGGKKG